MAKSLIDTCVLSDLTKARPQAIVLNWFAAHGNDGYLSVITLMELAKGIAKLRSNGRAEKADTLQRLNDRLVDQYNDRILPFDREAAVVAGRLLDAVPQATVEDIQIAATAFAHGMPVITLNAKDFVRFAPYGVAFEAP